MPFPFNFCLRSMMDKVKTLDLAGFEPMTSQFIANRPSQPEHFFIIASLCSHLSSLHASTKNAGLNKSYLFSQNKKLDLDWGQLFAHFCRKTWINILAFWNLGGKNWTKNFILNVLLEWSTWDLGWSKTWLVDSAGWFLRSRRRPGQRVSRREWSPRCRPAQIGCRREWWSPHSRPSRSG